MKWNFRRSEKQYRYRNRSEKVESKTEWSFVRSVTWYRNQNRTEEVVSVSVSESIWSGKMVSKPVSKWHIRIGSGIGESSNWTTVQKTILPIVLGLTVSFHTFSFRKFPEFPNYFRKFPQSQGNFWKFLQLAKLSPSFQKLWKFPKVSTHLLTEQNKGGMNFTKVSEVSATLQSFLKSPKLPEVTEDVETYEVSWSFTS